MVVHSHTHICIGIYFFFLESLLQSFERKCERSKTLNDIFRRIRVILTNI